MIIATARRSVTLPSRGWLFSVLIVAGLPGAKWNINRTGDILLKLSIFSPKQSNPRVKHVHEVRVSHPGDKRRSRFQRDVSAVLTSDFSLALWDGSLHLLDDKVLLLKGLWLQRVFHDAFELGRADQIVCNVPKVIGRAFARVPRPATELGGVTVRLVVVFATDFVKG